MKRAKSLQQKFVSLKAEHARVVGVLRKAYFPVRAWPQYRDNLGVEIHKIVGGPVSPFGG